MNAGIAFSGRSCSGKTWLAEHVVRDFDRPAQIFSFASAIKKEVYERYGILKEDVGGVEAIIKYGELRREADPFYWIRKVGKRIQRAQDNGIFVVVDDLRFLDELNWLSDRGFYLVRMVAPLWIREARLRARGSEAGFACSDLPSETELEGKSWLFHRRLLSTDGDASVNSRAIVREVLRP